MINAPTKPESSGDNSSLPIRCADVNEEQDQDEPRERSLRCAGEERVADRGEDHARPAAPTNRAGRTMPLA